jgi:catechol 2,3-dioxygenase-like lactoylglutathione lyase family enzyme
MTARLGLVTIVVDDYDDAIAFYVGALGFELREDSVLTAEKRWVVVVPPGGHETGLLLAKASTGAQRMRIGDQTGGRVGFFLHTDDFTVAYEKMRAAGVRFVTEPRAEPYGRVAVFEDLYGNCWDLIEPRATDRR